MALTVHDELGDAWTEIVGLSDQPEVPVVIDMQRRVGDETAQDPRVHQRDDRIVAAGQDERALPDEWSMGKLVHPKPARS
jgi:hypothetical protein